MNRYDCGVNVPGAITACRHHRTKESTRRRHEYFHLSGKKKEKRYSGITRLCPIKSAVTCALTPIII